MSNYFLSFNLNKLGGVNMNQLLWLTIGFIIIGLAILLSMKKTWKIE